MTKPASLAFTLLTAILFICSAMPAFANHGGGGGGGSHGGGGFHGGGGGGAHSSGGMRGGAPPAGAGYSRGAPNASNRSYGGSFSGGQRAAAASPARPAAGGGQWHSFGNSAAGRAPEAARSAAVSGGTYPGSGWHVFSGNRAAGSTSATRSFSGQGGEVWEDAPAARNVVPASRALSNIQGSLRSPVAGSAGFRGSASLSASSRLASGSNFAGNRAFSGSAGFAGRPQLGNSLRFGYPYGFRGGCWSCGFGFGFGGWGFGWGGFGLWNPLWFDPWWGPGPAYGYGYYGYPDSNVYPYAQSENYAPDDNSNPPPDQESEEPPNGNWVTPNGPSPSAAARAATLSVPVLIYMKGGAVYTVRDYWIVDGVLHYILMSGVQNSVDLEQVDLPRTNTENAKSGVKFIFKSEPNAPPPAPDGIGVPPTQPNSDKPSSISQPEEHT